MLHRVVPNVPTFDAVLVGFDVEGFSRTVEKATLKHGRAGGELAAQQILAGERVVTDLAHRAGLRFADALGDGAIYLRAQGSPSAREIRQLQRLQEELEYAHRKQTGLAVRSAWSHGPVRLTRPRAPMLEHGELLWGAAVASLHSALGSRPRGRRRAPETQAGRPDLMHREGEIAEMTFVFLRLCRSADWRALEEERLQDGLGLIARWAERLGGRLERVTQDEKGVHARVGLPSSDTPDWALRLALMEAQTMLTGLGLDGAIAAAAGPVYRGPSDHGSTIVHGGAVNRAAKLCAAQAPGALALDASLKPAPTRAVRTSAAVIGRGQEADKALAWLAGSGPRLVILSGEPGVGKSHLMHDLLTRAAPRQRALVSGAPARMLDPLGSWFELLGQGVAGHGDAGDDGAWAARAVARAGLEPWVVSLCARALRDVPAESPEIAALAPGERGRRTRETMLALVAGLAREEPWLIAIDDLHELDDASLMVTLAVLDAGASVRIIATARSTPDADRLSELRSHLSTLEIPLAPLNAPEIAQLVRSIGCDGVEIAEVLAICGGNPFQAVQAALALAEEGGGDEERTLTAILDRRIDRLDMDEREVLRALAIADRPWRPDDLAAIMRPDGDEGGVTRTIERLARARLVAPTGPDGGAIQVSHRLLAEGVRRRTPDGVRRRLASGAARHLAAARTPGRREPDVAIGRLWQEAGSRGRAAVYFERTARSAAASGADSARAQALALAIGLFEGVGDPLPRRSVRWLSELARAQWSMGLVDVANQTARRSIAMARRQHLPPSLAAHALAACALRVETGQFLGDVREIFVGSVEAARFGASGPESKNIRGRGLGALGYLLAILRLRGASDDVLRRAEGLATAEDGRPAAYALTGRAMVDFVFSRWASGEHALAEARRLCETWPEHQLMEWIETTCGIGAHLQGDGERALRHFQVLGGLAADRGSAMHSGWADYAAAQTLLALDRPHEAWARLISAEDHLKTVTDRQSHHICMGLRARLAWRLGEIDDALEAAGRCGVMSRGLAPTNHTSTEGFSAPALVGALALARPLSLSHRRAARALVRAHLRDLTSYAMVFPIARPRLAIVRAVIMAPASPAAAANRLEAVAASADASGLRFEVGLARRIRAELAERLV